MSSRLEFHARALAAKLRGFLSAPQHDNEFDDEIQEHLQLLANRFMAQGMSREQALRAARRQFGQHDLIARRAQRVTNADID